MFVEDRGDFIETYDFIEDESWQDSVDVFRVSTGSSCDSRGKEGVMSMNITYASIPQ